MRPPTKKGFTLVELLVVIAITGTLIALLLPAVQAARAAARATQCYDNLKQIGVALHAYHDIHKRLPSGWIADNQPEGQPGWGWAADLLLFLEHDNLHNGIHFDLPISDPRHQPVRETVLATFVCPSDLNTTTFPLGGLSVARANYIGVFGTLEIEDAPSDGDGTFFHNSNISFAEIFDGLSNTIIVGERNSELDKSTWVGVIEGADEALARVVGSTDHAPNDPDGHFDDFSSYHHNGAHFLLGDGSVRRLNESIDITVYRALATRAEGEGVTVP